MTNTSLPAEVRLKYLAIIDEILAKSDLTQVTEKRIRKGIQEQVQYDITPQKAAIKELILQRFDVFEAKQNGIDEPVPSVETTEPPLPKAKANGHAKSRFSSNSTVGKKREADDSDPSDMVDSTPASKKKRKDSVDDDAAFAARLQAEEDRAARPQRGGVTRKSAPSKKKKPPKKKTATKVTGSDDSEVDDNGGTTRKVNRETGFHKPMNLSPIAAEFFGASQISRPQITKKVWQYIKGHELQDPGDGRYIICDDKLKAVLKADRIHMFAMTKELNKHIHNPED